MSFHAFQRGNFETEYSEKMWRKILDIILQYKDEIKDSIFQLDRRTFSVSISLNMASVTTPAKEDSGTFGIQLDHMMKSSIVGIIPEHRSASGDYLQIYRAAS